MTQALSSAPGDLPLHDASADTLRQIVRERYGALAGARPHAGQQHTATDPNAHVNFATGRDHALALGYPADLLDSLPAALVDVFAGPAAPVLAAGLQPGERVLDIGCGAGMDAAIASRLVGPSGSVVGIDLTAELVERGTALLRDGFPNVTLTHADARTLPLADASVDVVVANGILNLEPDRGRVLREAARVLVPSGRFVDAEVILTDDIDRSALTVTDWFR